MIAIFAPRRFRLIVAALALLGLAACGGVGVSTHNPYFDHHPHCNC
jgi:hypothetical protein